MDGSLDQTIDYCNFPSKGGCVATNNQLPEHIDTYLSFAKVIINAENL